MASNTRSKARLSSQSSEELVNISVIKISDSPISKPNNVPDKKPNSKKIKMNNEVKSKIALKKDLARSPVDDIALAVANLKAAREDKKKLNLVDVRELKKRFKQTCDLTKREVEKMAIEQNKKTISTTRAGTQRGVIKRVVYSDGKWVNKGIDDSQEKFDDDEKSFLAKAIQNMNDMKDLKYEHIKYLIIDVYLDDLKKVKSGEITSDYHDRYKRLEGKSKMDLYAEIRTSLFTNEQRDYMSGLLQGAFDTTSINANGDIKHSDINYVEIVILAECIVRIVKHVLKMSSIQEAHSYMLKKSREAHGIGEDE